MSQKQINTLLLIDDNHVDQMLYKRIIDRSGLVNELIQCQRAEDALQQLAEGLTPDAILLDINMPGMNGFDFLEAVNNSFGTDFLAPVVMLTTSENPNDLTKAKQYQVVKDYFQKPLEPQQLQSVVQLVNN